MACVTSQYLRIFCLTVVVGGGGAAVVLYVCVRVLCCVCIQNEYMSKMCNSPVLGACNMAKRIRLFQEHTTCLIMLCFKSILHAS